MKHEIIVTTDDFKNMSSSEIIKFMDKDKTLAIYDDDDGNRFIVKRKLKQ